MPYNLSLTNTTGLTTLQDGTIDTASTSLTLVGKNWPGYGQFLNENLIYLLENFASGTQPNRPVPGQLWWDSANTALKVNSSDNIDAPAWTKLAAGMSGTAAPTDPNTGDFWWDTSVTQLKVYSGSGWVIVGPAFTSTTGTTGAIADTIVGTIGAVDSSYVVVKFYVANQLAAILSTAPTFTPKTAITGFAQVKPGFNLNSTTALGLIYQGNSYSSQNLTVSGAVVPATNFLRTDASTPITAQLLVRTNDGVAVGTGGNLTVSIVGTEARIRSVVSGTDTVFYNSLSGVDTKTLTLSGTTGEVSAAQVRLTNAPTISTHATTKTYVDSADQVTRANLGVTQIWANANIASLRANLGSTQIWANANIASLRANLGSTQIWANANIAELRANLGSTQIWANANIASLRANLGATQANIGVLFSGNLTTQSNIGSYQIWANATTFIRTTANTTLSGNIRILGNITPNANGTASSGYSLGNVNAWYSNVWSYTTRSVSYTGAQADLAEKFITDQAYPYGTVVQVGGDAEVTACGLNGVAIGVVSEKPAFLMNESAPGQAIALKGRVPVLVTGSVNKGDGLTAGPNGTAITTYSEANTPYTDPTWSPYIVRRFAVALENNSNEESKLVECIIL